MQDREFFNNLVNKDLRDDRLFYVQCSEINGCTVEIYGNAFATYQDFKDNYAFEARGMTFVYENGVWNKFQALTKFFNVNENDDWLYEKLKDKKIINVQEKLDGSLLHFVKINGKWLAKSKMAFHSEQAQMGNEFLEYLGEEMNTYLRKFLDWCYANSYTPLFELIGYKNQIVISYDAPVELILLQVRDKEGKYFNAHSLNKICSEKMIPVATQFDYTLDELMEMKKTEEGIEGWIVTFSDGTMAKIKTDWYLARHSVFTELREDTIILLALDEKMDDVISELTGEKKVYAQEITNLSTTKFNALVNEFKMLRWKYFNEHNENRKEFAMEYKDRPLFGWVMRTINTSFTEVNDTAKNAVKEYIKRQCNTLTGAKEFLK